MDDQTPPDFPSFKPEKPTMKGDRPARRDSLTKPGAPSGPSLQTGHPDCRNEPTSTEEMALKYVYPHPAERPSPDVLLNLISDHLKAPYLDGLNPESASEAQAKAGFQVLIPGCSRLMLGDEVILLWGNKLYPEHKVDYDTIDEPILCTQWIIYSVYEVVPQGKVAVCYDVYRDGQRIGTSAILNVNLHSCYTPSKKQRNRRRSIKRKNSRRPPL